MCYVQIGSKIRSKSKRLGFTRKPSNAPRNSHFPWAILHNSRRRRDKIAKSASYNSRYEDEKVEMKVENAKGMLRLGYSAFAVKLFVRR